MQAVHRNRRAGSRIDGGSVASAGKQHERPYAEKPGLPASGEPVGLVVSFWNERHPDGEQQQQAMTCQPHVARLRLEQHAHDRSRLEGGAGPAFEHRRLPGEAAEPEDDGHQQERARPAEHTRLPGARGGPARLPREQHHRESADDEHGSSQVDPADEQTDRHHAAAAMVAFIVVRAIFFDAGNTLLRMNYGAIAEALARHGVSVTEAALARADWTARVRLDTDLAAQRTSTETVGTADRYLRYLLEGAGVGDERVVSAMAEWRRGYNLPFGVWHTAEPVAAD